LGVSRRGAAVPGKIAVVAGKGADPAPADGAAEGALFADAAWGNDSVDSVPEDLAARADPTCNPIPTIKKALARNFRHWLA